MRTITTLNLLIFLNILQAQVPEGGIMMNPAADAYQKIGNCTVQKVAVEGQSFEEALRITVGDNVSAAWDAQIRFTPLSAIEKGDVVLVAFWARTITSIQETGESQVMALIEHRTTYDKELYHSLAIGSDWKEYYAPVVIKNSLATGNLTLGFHVGYKSQTLEMCQIRFLNYKNTLTIEDLPITETTYVGQAPDASWRAPAEERINQIRKGQAEITVYDDLGQPWPDAVVHVEMVQHQFGWGTAVVASAINGDPVYKNKVFEMFNEVVFENDLKWPQFQSGNTSQLQRAIDTLMAHQIGIRGHNVIWPAFRWCPDFVEDLKGDPAALRNAINQRIDEVSEFTEGSVIDWDVMNEPCSEHELQDILGEEEMALWFKRVRANDRVVKLYINDYSIISAGGKDIAKHDDYYEVIEYIDSLGGEIDGIGMQGHFDTDLTSIDRVYEILERFAELDKEIKITEHDINTIQRGVQADYTRDFMTICFSNPSVKSLLLWGFWENRHWRPDAALFDGDWTIRPHGEVWNEMIYDRWWTPLQDSTSDEFGKAFFEGFLGTYKYTVTSGETERSGTFSMDHSHQSGMVNQVLIFLDGLMPTHVEITPSMPGFLCQGETITLQATEGEGLSYTWYKNDVALPDETSSIVTGDSGVFRVKVAKEGMELESDDHVVEVRNLPEAIIEVEGDLAICPGTTLTLGANEGDLLLYDWLQNDVVMGQSNQTLEVGTSGVYTLMTSNNGCTALSDPVEVAVRSASDPLCTVGLEEHQFVSRVYPNPFREIVHVELNDVSTGNTRIEVFDAQGKTVTQMEVAPGTITATVTISEPGFFLMRITRGNDSRTCRLTGNLL
jgi:endo-1,4-beta-xylanase